MSKKAARVSDQEWLRFNYEEEQKSVQQIAELADCSTYTVYAWLHRYGISIRSRMVEKFLDREWLYHQYIELKKTQGQIAKEVECSRGAVQNWLKRHNIPFRTLSEAGKLRIPCSDEARQRLSEAIKNLPPRTEEQRRAISERMRRHWQDPIARAYHLETMRDKVWPPRSEGTYSPEFDVEFKQMIRQRDKHFCAICWLPGNNVHHIDYNKSNTTEENCIVLCRICHSATNFNRGYWQSALQKILVARAEHHLLGV